MAVQRGVKAGKISKPYGLRGEVHMILFPSVVQNIETGIPLFIDLDGQRVPYFIESADPVSEDQAIVKLEFIHSIEEAKKVSGCDVYLDPKYHHTEFENGKDELGNVLGYMAYDKTLGILGRVIDFVPSEMNPVWLIAYQERELMVPATQEFILSVDHKKQSIILDLPQGITDL